MVADNDVRALITARAADYFVVRRAGRVSDADNQEFLNWLRSSPVHVAEYLAIANVSKDLREVTKTIDIPLDLLADQMRAAENVVNIGVEKPFAAANTNKPFFARRAGVVAVIGLIFLAAGGVKLWPMAMGNTYATARGEQRTLQLADNTVVHLNSDSAVLVKFTGRERDVELLHGQAFFEVAKDAQRPFRVRAGETVIHDVGTVFDVFRTPTDTIVTVVEGAVTIQNESDSLDTPNRNVLADLTAGDQATVLSSGTVEKSRGTNLQKATAWTRNEIVFDGESVAKVAAEFNRYNRIQILVDDPDIGDLPISGVFHAFDVESFRQFLSGLPGVRVETEGRRIRVSSAAY